MCANTIEEDSCRPIHCNEAMEQKGYMVGYYGVVKSEDFINEIKQMFIGELAEAKEAFLSLFFSDQPIDTWGDYREEIEDLVDEDAGFGSFLKVDDMMCLGAKDPTIKDGYIMYKILLTGLEKRPSYRQQQKETLC